MAEYEELKTKIVVEADTKGADKAKDSLKDVEKEVKKTDKVLAALRKAGKTLPVNMMTPEMASEVADATSKLDLLERKVKDAREEYAKLFNAGASSKRLTSALESIQKAQANYNAELEKTYSQRNRDVMRLITPEEAGEFARNIGKMTSLQADLKNAQSKLAKYLNARMLGDNTAENDKRITDWSNKIQKIESDIQKLENASPVTKISEAFAETGEQATIASSKVQQFIETVEGMKMLTYTPQTSSPVENISAGDEVASMFAEGTATRQFTQDVERAASAVKNFFSAIKGDAINRVKNFGNQLSSVAGAFRRIMFYRAVRTIIKEIGEAFKDGVNNLYQWSKQLNGSFAQAMDKISTAGLYMKNSIGAMVAPLINAFAPVLDYLIDRFVDLLNVINQVLSLLSGATSWTKAIKYPKEYAKAVGSAASNAKKLGLAGIDQLTILDKHKGSSGSGFTAEDYAGMFKQVDEFNKRLENLIGKMKFNFNDVLFNWTDLTPESIAKKAIAGLSAFLGGAAGFIIGGVPGAVVGTLLGGTIGLMIDSVIFDNDGKLSKSEVAEMLRIALIAVTGGAIGFVTCGVGGALIGASVGMTLYGAIKGFDFLNGGTNGEDLLRELVPLLGTIGGALIGFKLGGGVGAVIGATIGLTIGFGIEDFGFSDTSKWTATDWIENIIHTFAPVVGTLIGFAVGGPGGAAIGALIGLGISFALKTEPKMDGENLIGGFWDGVKEKWNQFTSWLDRKWNDLKNWWRNLELPTFRIKTPHLSWSTEPAGGWIANILSTLGLPASLPKLNVSWYAKGGFPDAGQLFVANEAGAEMVGSMDGRTAVANQQEITDGIREGVYDAMVSALGNGKLTANVYLDGKQISGSVVKNVNNEIRRTGRSPILSY